jgi:hypothetical protein
MWKSALLDDAVLDASTGSRRRWAADDRFHYCVLTAGQMPIRVQIDAIVLSIFVDEVVRRRGRHR